MPRVKRNPEVPLFNFETNPEKTLAASTVASYKKHLNKITELSYSANKENDKNPVVANKTDLMNHPEYVLGLVKGLTDNRLQLCGIYSAIFYSIGRQELDKDNRAEPYVKAFQSQYYTAAYQQKLIDQAKV